MDRSTSSSFDGMIFFPDFAALLLVFITSVEVILVGKK